MDSTENEIWRIIPPEEKFELMAKAQSKGVGAVAIVVLVLCTISVGLKISWMMWLSFLIAPFVFQYAAGKAWRSLRPRALLEYLAARSASRRFAFGARGKELTAKLMFKGVLEKIYDNDHIQEAMEAIIQDNKESQVWISLFGDTITMISEAPGGAENKLSAFLDNRISISSDATEDGDYTSKKEVFLTVLAKDHSKETYKLTSKYPAALLVFEKKVKEALSKHPSVAGLKSVVAELDPEVNLDDDTSSDDKFNNLFSF